MLAATHSSRDWYLVVIPIALIGFRLLRRGRGGRGMSGGRGPYGGSGGRDRDVESSGQDNFQ